MKSIILLLSMLLLLLTLNNLRKRLWGKPQLSEYFDQGKRSVEIMQQTVSPMIFQIVSTTFVSLWIIFYSMSVNYLPFSKLIIIPVILMILTVYDYVKVIYAFQEKGLELPELGILDIPIMIVKSAYIIMFLSIYVPKL